MSSSTAPGSGDDLSLSEHHEKRRTIAIALSQRGGRATTSELKRMGGFDDTESVRYHAEILSSTTPPIIERDGTEDVGAPVEAVVYQLTDHGERLVAEHHETDTGLVLEEEVEYLRGQVSTLNDEIERAHDRIDTLNELLRSAGVGD